MDGGSGRVLVVGSGALGQVFGLRLARGGARVSYLVKPGQAGWERDGRVGYRLRRLGGPVAHRLRQALPRLLTVRRQGTLRLYSLNAEHHPEVLAPLKNLVDTIAEGAPH